jgi:uncharacterized protein
MFMAGTIINTAAILAGSAIGILFGSRLPERIRASITTGLGLFTALIGIQMFLKTDQSLIILGSVLLGALIGEWCRIEDGLSRLGAWLERTFISSRRKVRTNQAYNVERSDESSIRFIRGFMAASLLFCIGPIAILGSIQDGLSNDMNLLVIKSVLDLFASIAFASTLGIGVMFSAFVVLVYQGSLTLLAVQVQSIFSETMVNEMTATGGLLLLGIALSSLLEIKAIRIGNFLPAIFIAPLLVYFFSLPGF